MSAVLHHNRPRRWESLDPSRLTPAEIVADEIRRMENRDRYLQQSVNTRDGARAELPARQSLSLVGV